MPEIDIKKEDPRKFKQRKLRRRHHPQLDFEEMAELYADKHCEAFVTGWEISIALDTPLSRASRDALTAISKLLLMNAYTAGVRDRSLRSIHPGGITPSDIAEAAFGVKLKRRRDPRTKKKDSK